MRLAENNFSGNVPDCSAMVSLSTLGLNNNELGPDLSFISNLPSSLKNLYLSDNSVNHLTSLEEFLCSNNTGITSWTASTVPTSCQAISLQNCRLTESAVDQILSDINDNLVNRPTNGSLRLDSNNASPSAT